MSAQPGPPPLAWHDGILVARDDCTPGGTKARYIARLFEVADEVVYASPPQGGAQTALAYCARAAGKQATIFVAARAQPHPRSLMARRLGARVIQIRPGYLSVVRARAAAYARAAGALLAPFGLAVPGAEAAIAEAARAAGAAPREVWCAAGSGTLARGLAQAFPEARRHVVQVGRALSPAEVAGAEISIYPRPFDAVAACAAFPADPHYDAKAWAVCLQRRGPGCVLFWNVTGPAQG